MMKLEDILFLDIENSEPEKSIININQFLDKNRQSLRFGSHWKSHFVYESIDSLLKMTGARDGKIFNFLSESLNNGRKSIILAPDHRSTGFVLSSMEKINLENTHLVILDAHSDCQGDIENLTSYNVMAWISNHFPSVKKSLIGLRDIDTELIAESSHFDTLHTSCDIERIGIEGICLELVKAIGNRDVYLSIDVDVIDPLAFGAVSAPISGGISVRELIYLVKRLAGITSVIEIVEFCSVPARKEEYLLIADLLASVCIGPP